MLKYAAFVVSLCFLTACEQLEPSAPAAEDVMDAPLEGLTHSQNKLFLEGAEEFDEVYTSASGLGPVFVSNSCGSCHGGDNRGHLFTILTRFGQTDSTGNPYLHLGAPQIQNNAIIGHLAEVLPSGVSTTKLIAPIAAGVGFLELVPDADLLALSDPNDADGDGISGRPNWNEIPDWVVPSSTSINNNGKFICRFGRKGAVYNVHQQTVGAFNQDMGITSTYMPNNPYNHLEGLNPVPSADPEISDYGVNATVFYLQVLQTPFQRNAGDPQVIQGESIFKQIGCAKCHTQTLKTGFSPVEPLSYKTFHPYTDLLLHDMGPGLDDNYTEGTATTAEWRTTPLWGLGLATQIQGGDLFLLHDGRARSIEDAILMHGGESTSVTNAYRNLSSSEKQALLTFLNSL